jgi:hypothetical protein
LTLIVMLAACGSYKTQKGDTGTEDGTDDITTGDTAVDTPDDAVVDGVDDVVIEVPVDVVADADDDCPAVPPGCIDYCANEDGDEATDIGVQIRRCTIEYDERGCPYLDWTTEDCRPGTCDAATMPPECVDETTCSSGTCTCPAGARCTCGHLNCDVTCEGHCIVVLTGTNGNVNCADGSLCEVTCEGTNCDVECATAGTCSQTCDGLNCTMSCDSASSCFQDCNGLSCSMDCQSCTSCSHDCTDAGGTCTCTGCS